MQGSPEGPSEPRRPTVRRVIRRPVTAAREEPVEEPAEGGEPGRLLRPAAACPRCGARPAMRVTEAMVRALSGHDAGTRVGTYQCQRRGCGAIYDLFAAAYLRAS